MGFIAAEIRGSQTTKLGVAVIQNSASKDAFEMLLQTVGELRTQVAEQKTETTEHKAETAVLKAEQVELKKQLKDCQDARDDAARRFEALEGGRT